MVLGHDLPAVFGSGGEAAHQLVEREDLVLVLEGHLSFRDMIDKKVRAAQTKGLVYIQPITGAEKQGTA